MRHYKKGRKLGTDASHTKAMKKSLVAALFENDRIKTTEERAKEIRGDVDKVIGWAKKGDLHSRRLAFNKVGDQDLVREIFEKVEQGMWADRQGGYTRIMKLGPRKGDAARVVIMELVTEPVQAKKKEAAKKAPAKKAAPKKDAAAKKEAEAEKDAVEASEEAAEAVDAAEEAKSEEAIAEAAKAEDKPAAEEAAKEAEAVAEVDAVDAAEAAEKAEEAKEEVKEEEAAEKAADEEKKAE